MLLINTFQKNWTFKEIKILNCRLIQVMEAEGKEGPTWIR